MELTTEELAKSCEDNGLTCLVCGQGFMATLEDVISDNPGIADSDAKVSAMERMLEENVDFGPLGEEYDTDETHPERLEARWDILGDLAERWVDGRYATLAECQTDCTALARLWLDS